MYNTSLHGSRDLPAVSTIAGLEPLISWRAVHQSLAPPGPHHDPLKSPHTCLLVGSTMFAIIEQVTRATEEGAEGPDQPKKGILKFRESGNAGKGVKVVLRKEVRPAMVMHVLLCI